MTYSEAIEYIRKELHKQPINSDGQDAYIIAISAMQELDRYKKKLREVYGECSGLIEAVVDSLVKYKKMIGIKTPLKTRLLTDEDVDLWDAYIQFGSPEEVREAVEKQITKKLKGDYNSVPHYRCPTCNGTVKLYRDSDKDKICRWCSQNIDWGEEE